jgi:hypothetical protein
VTLRLVDGVGEAEDCHSTEFDHPVRDAVQNVELLSATMEGGTMRFTFRYVTGSVPECVPVRGFNSEME